MKKVLLFFVFILSISCIKAQKANTTQPFEGYIDYKNEYRSQMPGVTDEQMKIVFGENLRIYYSKDGSFKWIFTDSAGDARSYQTTIQKTHTQYLWYAFSPDTILSYDLSKTKRISIDTM